MNKEHYYDKLLNIKTEVKLMGLSNNKHYHPYEPTPYSALEELFNHYKVKSTDQIVDFGCGMGRINFFINHFYKASVVGIEMVEDLFQAAKENSNNYMKKHRSTKRELQFINCHAEEYKVSVSDTHFYFFNPFSIQIFMKIINNILLSFEEVPRDIELLLYYPSEDYTIFLETQTPFILKEEIVLKELYQKNPHERFVIYRLTL